MAEFTDYIQLHLSFPGYDQKATVCWVFGFEVKKELLKSDNQT